MLSICEFRALCGIMQYNNISQQLEHNTAEVNNGQMGHITLTSFHATVQLTYTVRGQVGHLMVEERREKKGERERERHALLYDLGSNVSQ